MSDKQASLSQSEIAAQNSSNQVLHSKDRPPAQQSFPQGRRVTIGGMNRRSSLGMTEAALGDLFGRRTSGFGELDVLGRRGSMDSTSAVLDAAIMDLTRRRLSMAMGSMPNGEVGAMGGLGDPLASMNAMGGLGGMDLGSMNPMNNPMNHPMSHPMNHHMNHPMSNPMNHHMNHPMNNPMSAMGGQLTSPLSAQAAAPSMMPSSRDSVSSINSRQVQMQEQQRDLERRQKELEQQRQQLVQAMEERRRVMSQMQQSMQLPPNGQLQRNPLGGQINSLVGQRTSLGGLGGSHLGGTQGLLMGLQNPAVAAAHQAQPAGARPQWFVCTICNSKAFSNREEATQHESLCAVDKGRRESSGNARRGSLDLLAGTLDRQQEFARPGLGGHLPQRSPSQIQQQQQQQMKQAGNARRDVRKFSLTGDSAGSGGADHHSTTNSSGPFAMMDHPLPLAMAPDKDWLTPLHCFVRQRCVQVFTATEKDVATPSKGKRKPIQVGQVGIRCPHCHHDETSKARERGSVYYPTTIASIYNATMNLLQRHLHNCSSVPADIMRRYETLKADDARSGTSKKYWVNSALSLGLVDTPNGIRFSALAPPPLPSLSRQQHSTGTFSKERRNSNDFFSSNSNAISDLSQRSGGGENTNGSARKSEHAPQQTGSMVGVNDAATEQQNTSIPETEQSLAQSAPLVTPEDEPYATGFSFHLLSQMQPCVFTEADRLGKRKGLPPGFPGLACRHCFGGYGSGRFFPSSIKTLSDTSKTLNVLHNHMMRCRKCPPEVRDTLDKLRKLHDEQRAKMKFGSQKAFFARIWDRLHYKDPTVNSSKRKFQAPQAANMGATAFHHPTAAMEAALQQGGAYDAALAMQQYHGAGDMMSNKRPKMS
jgi:hypothetical protein